MFRDEVRERLGELPAVPFAAATTADPVTAIVVVLHGEQAVAVRFQPRQEHVRRAVGLDSGGARSASTSSAMFTYRPRIGITGS